MYGALKKVRFTAERAEIAEIFLSFRKESGLLLHFFTPRSDSARVVAHASSPKSFGMIIGRWFFSAGLPEF
jgi:hypothetical protein